MQDYNLININDEKFKGMIMSTSFDDPLDKLTEFVEELKEKRISGYIVIDMLLILGNSFNRYFEIYFDGQNFNPGTLKIVSVKKHNNIRKMSSEYYKNNESYLNNSVLSNTVKRLITSGYII